ncbi:MAG: hypothetical protein JNL10_09035 [Verrucomicrobiales bacterium]|nr:hypothetical protein [Verrucomicrobiales bacterium]
MNSAPTPSKEGPLPSHVYELRGAGIATNLAVTLGLVLLIGLAVSVYLRSPVAPGPSFSSDPDSAILAAKVELARSSTASQLALVGDSSCLIDLDVSTLESVCRLDVVNLGTLSYLSLDSFGVLAGELLKGKEAPRVVLVVHPDCLRITSPSVAHRAVLDSALGVGPAAMLQTNDTLSASLGFDEFRVRVSDRWIPHPLKGAFGNRYGFTSDLRESLLRRKGTMDESARFDAAANRSSAEYRMAPRVEEECRLFRQALPPKTRIRVIVTPVPRSHALKSHEQKVQEMRSQLEEWLGAETPSFPLPLILPDADFGTVTHLTPEAAVRYSRWVGEALCSWK